MRFVPGFKPRRFLAPLLLVGAGLAQAQYSWIDEKGVREFSDRPPPPGTPAEKILKAPRHAAVPATAAQGTSAARPDAAAQPGAYPNEKRDPRPLAVRQQAFIHSLKVMTAKPALRDEKAEQERRCLMLHRYRNVLVKGIPWNKAGDSGEQRPITKEERASELARTDAELASCPTT